MPALNHKTRSKPVIVAPEVAIYVHWPFCRFKCPYCDFNSHVRGSIDQQAYLDAFLREIDHYAGAGAAGGGAARLASIFFGGGTPSLMEAGTVRAIIDAISVRWPGDDSVEITLEANPNSVEAEKFTAFKDAGVNRISIGVQSFDEAALKALGRLHGVDEALAAIELARTTFNRFSFDLIYARPGQSLDQWQAELTRALALRGDHLSLYQLTIEPGTAFQGLYDKGKLVLPQEGLAADMFEMTGEMCGAAGIPAYEISNHAVPGGECRHNLVYWQGGAYIGIGPGAHGRLIEGTGAVATENHKKPEHWLKAVGENGHGRSLKSVISPAARTDELIMMGLRLKAGINLRRFKAQCGGDFEGAVDANALQMLLEDGFLEMDAGYVRPSAAGWPLLNPILQKLLASKNY
jgi:putative oxygen-independent coproporphyrinogen III oxidase